MEKKSSLPEPFKRYPESLIDSKEKAIKVIKDNAYYFYIIGTFSIFAGTYFIATSNDKKDIFFGYDLLVKGTIYFILTYSIIITKSRLLSLLLSSLIIIPYTIEIFNNYNNGLSIFKLLILFSSYRILKSTFYYNK